MSELKNLSAILEGGAVPAGYNLKKITAKSADSITFKTINN